MILGSCLMIGHHFNQTSSNIDQLPQAILAKAFRGELVSQEVKVYVVEESEGLMAEEPVEMYGLHDKTIKL